MAQCDDDIVVLDTRADLYCCLPEAAGSVVLWPAEIEADEEVLDQLSDAGFCDPAARSERRALPPSPLFALDYGRVSPKARDWFAVASGMVSAWHAGPGRRSLGQLLETDRRHCAGEFDLDRAARLTAVFVRLLPWDPAQGACLYRAWLLRRVLQRRGLNAVWVFGVRTWPFGAHCWLQIDDCVLDDDPDRVAQYTPIMAV